MPSPVRYGRHSHPHIRLVTWLGIYETDTPGVEAGDNGTVRLDLDNEPQPDAFLIIRPEHGGQARISEDDYIEGAPELVAEVASSSVSYDLGKKLQRLPPKRGARVRRLAGPGPPGRLVREPRRALSSRCPLRPMASSAAPCFPASGSIPPPWCAAIRRRSRRSSSKAWTPPSTPTSWPGWSGPAAGTGGVDQRRGRGGAAPRTMRPSGDAS